MNNIKYKEFTYNKKSKETIKKLNIKHSFIDYDLIRLEDGLKTLSYFITEDDNPIGIAFLYKGLNGENECINLDVSYDFNHSLKKTYAIALIDIIKELKKVAIEIYGSLDATTIEANVRELMGKISNELIEELRLWY